LKNSSPTSLLPYTALYARTMTAMAMTSPRKLKAAGLPTSLIY
jgi:hypothetical protein